jgi:hypothetical protein
MLFYYVFLLVHALSVLIFVFVLICSLLGSTSMYLSLLLLSSILINEFNYFYYYSSVLGLRNEYDVTLLVSAVNLPFLV